MRIRDVMIRIIAAPFIIVATAALLSLVLILIAIELVYGIILLPFLLTYYLTNRRRYYKTWN